MPKSLEQFSESDSEGLEVKSQFEVLPGNEPEKKQELKQENQEEKEQEIERLKEEIEKVGAVEQPAEVRLEGEKSKKERIKEYQDRYLPDHLRKKGVSIVSKIFTYFRTKGESFDKEGQENIPEQGPFIVICNHFGGGEPESLIRTFQKNDLHFAAAKEMWWNQGVIVRWFLKKFGTFPVEESLANLTEKEKEEALLRQGKPGQAVFRKIIDREKDGRVATNIEFVRQAVALLSRGDAVGVMPEGLWLNPHGSMTDPREKEELKRGYSGIELVARQYKKLTGEELPIIPTAFIEDKNTGKKKVVVGKPLLLSENDGELSGIDWCMAHVAQMLPEEQRGYYKELSEEK